MKTSDNKEDQNGLRKIWQASDNLIYNKYKLTYKDMENILLKESTSFLKKFRANIYFDMVFKCVMCSGLIIMWITYPSNLLVAGTALILAIFNGLLMVKLSGVLKAGQSSYDLTQSTADNIKTSIGFYAGQFSVMPLSWGLSAGTFYVLGSFLYHHFKYGTINPFQDIQDIVVLCMFLVIGIVFAYLSHHFATRDQFRNLLRLAADVKDENEFQSRINKYKKVKANRLLLGIFVLLFGLVLLITLLLLFRR